MDRAAQALWHSSEKKGEDDAHDDGALKGPKSSGRHLALYARVAGGRRPREKERERERKCVCVCVWEREHIALKMSSRESRSGCRSNSRGREFLARAMGTDRETMRIARARVLLSNGAFSLIDRTPGEAAFSFLFKVRARTHGTLGSLPHWLIGKRTVRTCRRFFIFIFGVTRVKCKISWRNCEFFVSVGDVSAQWDVFYSRRGFTCDVEV